MTWMSQGTVGSRITLYSGRNAVSAAERFNGASPQRTAKNIDANQNANGFTEWESSEC